MIVFLQSVEQTLAQPETRGFLAGLTVAGGVIVTLLIGLYRGFVQWAKGMHHALASVSEEVREFRVGLGRHEADDTHRFSEAELRGNDRHRDLMAAIHTHANAMTVAVTSVQIEFAEVKERLRGVENRLPERRENAR